MTILQVKWVMLKYVILCRHEWIIISYCIKCMLSKLTCNWHVFYHVWHNPLRLNFNSQKLISYSWIMSKILSPLKAPLNFDIWFLPYLISASTFDGDWSYFMSMWVDIWYYPLLIFVEVYKCIYQCFLLFYWFLWEI